MAERACVFARLLLERSVSFERWSRGEEKERFEVARVRSVPARGAGAGVAGANLRKGAWVLLVNSSRSQ